MNEVSASLLAEVVACSRIVEDFTKRLDEACAEYYATGKTGFTNLTSAENEQIKEHCELILSRLSTILPDSKTRWDSIEYRPDPDTEMVVELRDIWVRRRSLFQTIEHTLRARLELENLADESKDKQRARRTVTEEPATHRGLSVFISHSGKDAELALRLIDLLQAGLRLNANEIRCSSVDGYRFPVGVNTQDKLREEVNAAKVVVGLITPSSLNSYYVMFELGARWGANRFIAPLLAGVNRSDLKEPLRLLKHCRLITRHNFTSS